MDESPIIYPSDRSMPPVMSTMVIPMQAIAGMAACFKMSAKLLRAKKWFTKIEAKTTSSKMTTILPFLLINSVSLRFLGMSVHPFQLA